MHATTHINPSHNLGIASCQQLADVLGVRSHVPRLFEGEAGNIDEINRARHWYHFGRSTVWSALVDRRRRAQRQHKTGQVIMNQNNASRQRVTGTCPVLAVARRGGCVERGNVEEANG